MPNSATRHLIINLIFITITQTLTLRTQLSKYAPLYDYFVSFLSTQKSPLGFQQSNFMNLIQIPKKKLYKYLPTAMEGEVITNFKS